MRIIQKFDPGRIAIWTLLLFASGVTLFRMRHGQNGCGHARPGSFRNMRPCHNADGSGNAAVGAPNIAGMKEWYVERELDKFRSGVRGMHFSDVEGMRMRPMALSLTSEDDVKAVARYVETLPPVPAAHIAPGDPKGRRSALYATCSSCHGDNGVGKSGPRRRRGLPEWMTGTWPRS
jgi:cytochrome c553